VRLSKGALTVAAILGALFVLGSEGDADALTVKTSTGPRQGKHTTYEGDVATWAKARYKLARDYFKAYWSKALDDQGIRDAALSVLAQWSLETGSGAGGAHGEGAESNFNVGNIRAVGSQPWYPSGDYNPKTGKGGRYQFASYGSMQEGVDAYFRLLESDYYKDCMGKLTAAPTSDEWFRCLGEKGYYAKTLKDPKTGIEKDNLGPAAAGWASRRALMAKYAVDDVAGDFDDEGDDE
jgi:hypothetical protein